MHYKLQYIADKLSCTRTDVWECEMMDKLVRRELHDDHARQHLFANYNNPFKEYPKLLNRLFKEAQNTQFHPQTQLS